MIRPSTKLALSLVLASALAIPALAQDNFPDVPANHWAYEALAQMKKDGLLVGYPDGLFRGSRPASRYELAVAMNAVYTNLHNLIDGLDAQLKALQGINPQDIQNLKDQVAQLQSEVAAMKGWGDDIAALKRATEQFDKELRSLGVDVEAMKKDLGDLADRVTRLEKRKPAVDISGDLDFFAVTTNSDDHKPGITQNGRFEGVSGGVATGLFHDLAIFHEGAFTFAGTNETGPKWKVTAVVGNTFGANGLGNQSSLTPGGGGLTGSSAGVFPYAAGNEDVYIQDASIRFDTSIIGLAFNAEAGRVAYSLSPYVLQRPNTEVYYENSRWDDGKYRFDGAILGFNVGIAKVHVFGGNTSNLTSVQGVELNPVIVANTRVAGGGSEALMTGPGISGAAGNLGIMDRAAGADAALAIGKYGHVNLEYLLLEQEGTSSAAPGTDHLLGVMANRDSVWGADGDIGFGRFKVSGGVHKSDLNDNENAVNTSRDNIAWNAMVKYSAEKWNLWGGYRQVDTEYFAPGDWGTLGIVYNPGNIAGWQAGGHLDLTSAFRLTASGEWDKGMNDEPGAGLNSSPWDRGSTIDKYYVRGDFRVNPNLSVYGAWEDTTFNNLLYSSNKSFFDFTTIGIGYGLSANTKFNLAYQFSNGGFGAGVGDPLGGPGRYTGGILTSQLTVKF